MDAIAAVEITSFMLCEGYKMTDFIMVNEDIDPWLKKQHGFRSRYMAEQSDGRIVDILIWDTVEDGSTSMHRLMKEFSNAAIHDMIDQNTVSWKITPIYHEV